MIKILLGGSPCTYWSIAQSPSKRETTASGIGWELFKNYLIARNKFKPDIFLYENNKSAAPVIKQQIREELSTSADAKYIEIDSALVSAQHRERFYVHNCGNVELPPDRHIYLRDIIDIKPTADNVGEAETIQKALPKLAAKYGYIPEMFNAYNVQEIKCKSPTLSTGSMVTSSCATTIFTPTDKPIYKAAAGAIKINNKTYPTRLAEGYYIMRKLSVAECARLQTLPDNYCDAVSSSQAHKGLGNGWTAEVVIHILKNALNGVPTNEKIVVLSMYDGIATGRYCLDKLGFNNIEYHAYEIDKHAIKVAQSNYADIKQHGDAFALRSDDWDISDAARVDPLATGGGGNCGGGINDPRTQPHLQYELPRRLASNDCAGVTR